MQTHPFDWITERGQRGLLWALTGLLVATSAWLSGLGEVLVTEAAPVGIVSFELAGSLARADAILESWSSRARSSAMLLQGLDFLYLIVYPAWFSLAVLRLGRSLGGAWRPPAFALSWAVLLAAPLDGVENHALIQQLMHGASDELARLALYCAVPKFALVLLATTFLGVAGIVRLTRRKSL